MDIVELGKHPISEANPSGEDARYEPEYDELQSEIDKLSSVTGGEIDWKRVVKVSHTLLSSKTKDIKVASYLGVALTRLKGVDGFATGVQILLDMVEGFWDTLYPAKKRMRGRLNALTWWEEQNERFLREYDGEELPSATVQVLVQRLRDLDSALAEKTDEAPVLSKLADFADRLPVKSPEKAAEEAAEVRMQEHRAASEAAVEAAVDAAAGSTGAPAAPAPAPSAPASGLSASSTPVGQIGSHEEYRKILKERLSELGAVADYLLTNDPVDRVGYRLRRISAWMSIPALPPNQDGKTMIPGPDALEKGAVVNLLEGRDFLSALRAAESRVSQYLFWLDLSRLSVEALDGLGGPYRDAMLALETEVQLFTRRLPGLENLSFADGTPFADGKTKAWLKSLSSDEPEGLPADDGSESASTRAFAEASRLAKEKKVFDAVSVLQNTLNATSSIRERFLLRLGLIRLLTDVGQGDLARAHVEEVLEQIESYRLEQWEPDLALRGLKAAYSALTTAGGEDSVALSKRTLQRIGRLNPAVALKINGLN